MQNVLKSFLRKLILFSVILAALCTLLAFVLPTGWVSPAMPFLLIFFMAHTLFFHKMASDIIRNNMRRFTQFYMLSTVAKLVLFLIVILGYAFAFPSDAKAFTVWFFVFYVFYTVFELSVILPYLRRKHNPPPQQP